MRLVSLLWFASCVSASPPPAPAAPASPPVVPAPAARVGVEPRTQGLATAPVHGLLLESFGLVNETFRITVDFDAKRVVHATTYAVDGRVKEVPRDLSEAEVTALTEQRERVWTTWTASERRPAAEYQEHLYLLDGEATTHLRADDGFHDGGVAATLAERVKGLARAAP